MSFNHRDTEAQRRIQTGPQMDRMIRMKRR